MALSVAIAVFWNEVPCSLVLSVVCEESAPPSFRAKIETSSSETSWPVGLLCVTYH
jgi:hypothetical protein